MTWADDLGNGTVALVVALVVLALWMLGAHNRVTALRATVLAQWAPVEAALQQRGQALGALLAQATEPLAAERAALDAVQLAQAQVAERVDALRRRPVQQAACAELAKADAALAAAQQRLLSLVDQQAGLSEQPAVRQALADLAECRPRLNFARQSFNEAGAVYNAAVLQFPTRLLAPVFRFGQAGKL